MAKTATFPLIIDRCLTVSIADLIRWGCLKTGLSRSGTVHWEQAGKQVASIGYRSVVSTVPGQSCIQFDYRHDGQPVQYTVPLVSAPANIGKGLIWFFRCPFTGQRCKKLHLIQGRFMHRSAARHAMYKQQTTSKRWRLINRFFDVYELQQTTFEALHKPGFKEKYRGKETRRFARLIRQIEKAEKRVNVREALLALG